MSPFPRLGSLPRRQGTKWGGGIERKSFSVDRKEIFRGKVVDLGIESVELPNGQVWDLEVVRHPGAAAVLPLTDRGDAVLVRQFRHAAGGWILEVPAGKLDPGEEPADCARRETEEEVGYRVGSLRSLGWIFTTPGFTDEKIHLFLATDLEAGQQALEEDELLTVVKMPLERAARMALDGEIQDAKTAVILLRAAALLRDAALP